MIPQDIKSKHVIKAIQEIDSNGILPRRKSRRFLLSFKGKKYPPKYVLSLAKKYSNGKELDPSRFSGGQETNYFLKRLGFAIRQMPLANYKNIKNAKGEGIKNKIKNNWLATVVLRSDGRFGQTDNNSRQKVSKEILNEMLKRTNGNGVILFPGGYFNSGKKKANVVFNFVAKPLKEKLRKINRNIIVCLGVDGGMGKGYPKDYPKDQLALAVSKKGIIAIGRKFNPIEDEENKIYSASNYRSLEVGKSRIFSLNGRRFFLAVCYDIFGVKQLPNPGVDIILNVIHQFTPRCKCKGKKCNCGAASGDVDFARKGLAGASKAWNSPVFGSVVFFNRSIPQKWPSGVYWNQGNKSVQKWQYKNNPIKTEDKFELLIKEGVASVRIYDISRSVC